MAEQDDVKVNQVAIMVLALALGVITPLLARRTYDGVFGSRKRRILHKLNALHNSLYFILTFATIIVKIYIPVYNCFPFRLAQGIVFHLYILLYELVLGMKAKTIIGHRIILRCADLSVGSALLLVSMAIRAFSGVMSVWHADVQIWNGLCVNVFHPQWQLVMNYTRNILEIFWSALFVIPLYSVVHKSNKAGAIAIVQFMPTLDEQDAISTRHPGDGSIRSKSSTGMRHLLVASMIFPFCASLISIALSIYMNFDGDIHPGWGSIMHGIQNFVSTLSINLILNMRVAKNETSHSVDCDHVRSYNNQMTSRRRYRDTESTDEWESTDYDRNQLRKPSVVSFDLHHISLIASDSHNNHIGDMNAGTNLKPHPSAGRHPLYILPQRNEAPISPRRTSFVTTLSTSATLQTSIDMVDASTLSLSSIELNPLPGGK